MSTAGGDYVLGTHDGEVARLGLQHRVWREAMFAAWRRAGIRTGWRVVDVGAGPGYATLDLAELVGASGEVLAGGALGTVRLGHRAGEPAPGPAPGPATEGGPDGAESARRPTR